MAEVHTLLVPGVLTRAPLLPPVGLVDELRQEALLRCGARFRARIGCGDKENQQLLNPSSVHPTCPQRVVQHSSAQSSGRCVPVLQEYPIRIQLRRPVAQISAQQRSEPFKCLPGPVIQGHM